MAMSWSSRVVVVDVGTAQARAVPARRLRSVRILYIVIDIDIESGSGVP
jgi:hypothetical protein